MHWLVAGGGDTPELNQVQLEQDLKLARDVLSRAGSGVVLYAGGPGSRAVQVWQPRIWPDRLRFRLAQLLHPKTARTSRFRAAQLRPHAAASAARILDALSSNLHRPTSPLTVYLAGHGAMGDAPSAGRFLTWSAGDLWVTDLAEVLDQQPGHRPLRLVVTSCHAGSFAELAFHAADPEQGPARTERCGLFATTWDRAAAGCDPNPDRGAQEGYGIHFLHALAGEDRHGRRLALEDLDMDGDGEVSLLEAHTRARTASASLDVPVTTSEVFLRAAVGEVDSEVAVAEVHLPEEDFAVKRLSARLSVEPAAAAAKLKQEERLLHRSEARLEREETALSDALETLRDALLHRWPFLDDPWHPAFEASFRAKRASIARLVHRHPARAAVERHIAERDRAAEEHDQRQLALAPLVSLVRALRTQRLAARLRAQGGAYWQHYRRLLECERGRLSAGPTAPVSPPGASPASRR